MQENLIALGRVFWYKCGVLEERERGGGLQERRDMDEGGRWKRIEAWFVTRRRTGE